MVAIELEAVITLKAFATLKHYYKVLRDGRPGRRFRDYIDERRKGRSGSLTIGRIVSFLIGFALIVAGLGIGWLPGPGGFLAIIGLALIAQEIPWIAAALDVIELQIRSLIRSSKRLMGFVSSPSILNLRNLERTLHAGMRNW